MTVPCAAVATMKTSFLYRYFRLGLVCFGFTLPFHRRCTRFSFGCIPPTLFYSSIRLNPLLITDHTIRKRFTQFFSSLMLNAKLNAKSKLRWLSAAFHQCMVFHQSNGELASSTNSKHNVCVRISN